MTRIGHRPSPTRPHPLVEWNKERMRRTRAFHRRNVVDCLTFWALVSTVGVLSFIGHIIGWLS